MKAALPVLINLEAGGVARGSEAVRAIERAFAGTGRAVVVELLAPREMRAAFARHAEAPVVVVGGGDGTVGLAAACLARSRTAIGILPLGERNHIARQLGVPQNLKLAALVAATGERRRVDLGCIGHRQVFIDSAFVGGRTCPAPGNRAPGGWLLRAGLAWRALFDVRQRRFGLVVDRCRRDLRTPCLLIGNGHWRRGGWGSERCDLPADAALSLRALAAAGPFANLAFAWRMLSGRTHPDRDFTELEAADSIEIEGFGEIDVELDGEAMMMELPLRFSVLPSALGVVLPRVPAIPAFATVRSH